MLQILHGVNTPLCVSPFLSYEVSSSYVFLKVVLSFFSRCSFSNHYIRSLLRPAHPERFPDKFSVSPVITIIQSFLLFTHSLSLSHTHTHTHNCGGCNSWSGRCSHIIQLLLYLQFLFPFQTGSTPPQGPILHLLHLNSRTGSSFGYL
jgi:hypothetical protein